MATLSFTLTGPALAEVIDVFGETYQATINGQPNPESKPEFARRQVIALLRNQVQVSRRVKAAAAADQTDPDIT